MLRKCSTEERLFAVLLSLVLIGGPCAMAQAAALFPWESESSVEAALAGQDGQSVACEAAVGRIAARSNPPFFVLEDSFSRSRSRIAVLCRPASSLRRGNRVLVEGVLGRLANGEHCIMNPTVCGYPDARGNLLYWMPFPTLEGGSSKQVLPVPTGPIPPSDPSLPDDGMGIPGEASAYTSEGVWRFDTLGSLLATAPPVLTAVELTCKPVKRVGDGFIVVGQDSSDAAVKVFTNELAQPGDRILRLSGTVHTQNGSMVLYAGAGPCFDRQGFAGGVTTARPGTTAYASTLSDTRAYAPASIRVASVDPPGTDDGDWVYLTGRVINYADRYYSYDIPNGGWINVYNIQTLDRTPGIRVWRPASPISYDVGSIVDVMAKVDTKDGQRILGEWSTSESNALNLTSPTHSIEPKVLDYVNPSNPAYMLPVGVINRDLGGGAMGNNPSVTGGKGLYNIGSSTRVWGEVLEAGTYQFNEFGDCTTPYMRLDDGSGVPSGNCDPSYGGPYGEQGVTVFGTNTYIGSVQVDVGDYLSVAGVSDVWKPGGSTDTYRCVWTSADATGYESPPSTAPVTDTGTVSGVVKLYDMPQSTATVRLYSTCDRSETLTITRGGDNSGSASFSWEGVPKEIDNSQYPEYILSAQCDGFKTRTYTHVVPDTPRNLYLPRLRKVYVMTDNRIIEACSGSTVITATVVDSDRQPLENITVRFKTNKGSFSSSSIAHDHTDTTDANGQATATLYGVVEDWGSNDVVVKATDDSAPVSGDNPDDDPYGYDWQHLHDQYGEAEPYGYPYNITITAPTTSLALQPDPIVAAICENQKSVTATLLVCGSPESGKTVTFHTTNGTFQESGTDTTEATTDGNGEATATLLRPVACEPGEAEVWATSSPYDVPTESTRVSAHWQSWRLKVKVSPDWVVSGTAANVKAKLTLDDGTTPVVGQSVVLTTDHGAFSPCDTGYPQRYTANTNSSGEISTTLTVTECPVTATVSGTTSTCSGGCTFTDSDTLLVICNAGDAKTLVIALDWTFSMRRSGTNKALEGLTDLMYDLKASQRALWVGGVKFSDGVNSTYMLPLTRDYETVVEWLQSDQGADDGADTNENGLQALKTASEFSSACYIALATDAGFHYWTDPNDENSGQCYSYPNCQVTTLTAFATYGFLATAGSKVYIDAGDGSNDDSAVDDYTNAGLYVGGAMESSSFGSYEFPFLETALSQ